jgi:D-alanyl-D-alanine carboxypeptidase
LRSVENGKLGKALLKKTKIGALMWTDAALGLDLLVQAAAKDGITLVNIGDYRPYARQVTMFKDRYSLKDMGRKPQVKRVWNKQVYYLKPGKSPSATPGRSNHGTGLAVDLAVKDKKGNIKSLGSDRKAMRWMCNNAPKYGFYLQTDDPKSAHWEPWHWQYAVGDDKTPAIWAAIAAYAAAVNAAQKPKK